jgi:uncharacterized protein with LGFP repeats
MNFERLTFSLKRTLLALTLVAAVGGASISVALAEDASPEQRQAIEDKWRALPEWAYAFCAFTGTPQSTTAHDGAFWFCGLEGKQYGAIYTSDKGTFFIWGESLQKWGDAGYEASEYGYPISDTGQLDGGNGSFTFFGRASRMAIYTDSQFTAGEPITVREPVLSAWEDSGWEAGPHGWPATDIKTQNFANGRCKVGERLQNFDLQDGEYLQNACVRENGSVYWQKWGSR